MVGVAGVDNGRGALLSPGLATDRLRNVAAGSACDLLDHV